MTQKAENRQPSMDIPGAPVQAVGTVPTGLIPLNDATADRLRRIADAAYKRAQSRHFAPGHDLEDWLEAEKEIDAEVKGRPAP
jgi:hypothetical protein